MDLLVSDTFFDTFSDTSSDPGRSVSERCFRPNHGLWFIGLYCPMNHWFLMRALADAAARQNGHILKWEQISNTLYGQCTKCQERCYDFGGLSLFGGANGSIGGMIFKCEGGDGKGGDGKGMEE